MNKDKEFLERLLWAEDFLDQVNKEEIYQRLLSLDEHIQAMEGFEQKNPHHVYDVLWHTFHTVDNVKKEGVSEEDYRQLRIAAFFHDIGKPLCMSETMKNGKIRRHFHGHPIKSAEITKPILERLSYSKEGIERILFFVKYHDAFMDFRLKEDANLTSDKLAIQTDSILRRIHKLERSEGKRHSIHDFLVLTTLMRADAMAQAPIVIDEFGKEIDSMEAKVCRVALINKCLEEVLRS